MKINCYTSKKLASIIIGAFFIAIALNTLLLPNKILSGGVAGLAGLLNIIFNIQPSTSVILLNIPLFILAYFFINRKFFVFSLIGMLSLSFFIKLTSNFTIETSDILVAAIAGGILSGLGSGIIIRFNCSTGGGDIIAKIMYKYFGYSISLVILLFNCLIILLSISFFGLDKAIYTLLSMFISSRVSGFVIEGLSFKKSIFIVSDKHDEITNTIINQLHRGVTLFDGEGAFTHTSKHILYCIVGTREVAKLKLLIKKIDPLAFITITQTSQVIGHGRGFIDINSED